MQTTCLRKSVIAETILNMSEWQSLQLYILTQLIIKYVINKISLSSPVVLVSFPLKSEGKTSYCYNQMAFQVILEVEYQNLTTNIVYFRFKTSRYCLLYSSNKVVRLSELGSLT